MCDTTLTGSDSGTSERPKFSLLACFMVTIFPKLEQIIAEDGDYLVEIGKVVFVDVV